MTVSSDGAPGAAPGGGLLLGPPGWRFYAVLALLALVLLASVSVPGIGFFTFVGACGGLVPLGVIWVRKLRAIRPRATRSILPFLLGPLAGLVVLTLVVLDAPFEARWALSRSAFEAEVQRMRRDVPVAKEPIDVGDKRLGWFSITTVDRVPGGLLFHESTGDLFNNAGFAYLPDGPTPDLANGSFEDPQFEHLGGPWYAWTASW
jgi:hypothetical protein